MYTADQYRAKAIEYSNLLKIANGYSEEREFQRLERSSAELADNAQWVTENQSKSCRPHRAKPRSKYILSASDIPADQN